jgi:hypothetical protein
VVVNACWGDRGDSASEDEAGDTQRNVFHCRIENPILVEYSGEGRRRRNCERTI